MLLRLSQNKCFRIAIAVSFFAMSGCCKSTNNNAIDAFRQKHHNEAKTYTYLCPVRMETFKAMYSIKSGTIYQIADGLQANFGKVPAVIQYADRIIEVEKSGDRWWYAFVRKSEEIAASGGAVCQFESSDDNVRQTGLLLLKGGEVVERIDFSVESKGK